MIDEKKLIDELEKHKLEYKDSDMGIGIRIVKEIIEEQPKISEWIPVSERLPKERDSMFKKFKGTNKWNDAMFETISNKVNVTIEFKGGKRATDTSNTTDGKWRCEREYGLGAKVIAWMPLPEPYKEEK